MDCCIGQRDGDYKSLYSSLLDCKSRRTVIGKHGAWVKHGNYKDLEPEFPAKRVDTTAAGDNFAAGFIYGLVNNWSLDKCVMAGNIIAGNVIEVVGATMDAKRWTRIKDEIAKLA